ncbi:7618_t:CDS:2 [Ambispora leptoticha]|uniref:7618_t:CDS:1 n=1 Tax=Ambispora leptoticha TaxID=144679 RepID=A0A9N8Z5X6_9GLOM|nr:7618_t:CDS:2 [Ambispora leptoticha]
MFHDYHHYRIEHLFKNFSQPPLGSTGSHLLDGNSDFHHAESALIFTSRFDANVGFFSSVPQPGDAIILDRFVHASVHDGVRNSCAKVVLKFLHNDLEDLTRQLDKTVQIIASEKNIFIAVESLYSMEGDIAPLREIVEILKSYNVYLMVDEAHATGVYGEQGRGTVCELGLEDKIFALAHIWKALASNGASELGAQLRERLKNLITLFRSSIKIPSHMLLPSTSAIQGIIILAGYSVKPIRSPTIPPGRERVRICMHADNTKEQVLGLVHVIERFVADSLFFFVADSNVDGAGERTASSNTFSNTFASTPNTPNT